MHETADQLAHDIGPNTIARNAELVLLLTRRGLIQRVLLSQNLHGHRADLPRGGRVRPYHVLFKALIPELFRVGLELEQVERLTVIHPMRAFTVGVRHRIRRYAGAGMQTLRSTED